MVLFIISNNCEFMSHYPQYLKIVMLFSVISSYAAILNELLSRSTYIAQLMQMCIVVPFSGKKWQHPHSDKLIFLYYS